MSISGHFGTAWTNIWIEREFSQNKALRQFKSLIMLYLLVKKLEKSNEVFSKKSGKGHFGTVWTKFWTVQQSTKYNVQC